MKATRRTIPGLIAKREPFQNDSGTLRAEKNPVTVRFTKLNDLEKSRLRIDADTQGIAYIVYSYDTPIAWETKSGWVYKVEQTFTQTTSKHQAMLVEFRKQE